jgi:hypothetical protein
MWAAFGGVLDDPPRRFRYPGRPRYTPRACLEGILYVLFTDSDADKLDWSRVIVDASLVDAKKGARRSRARSWAGRAAATTSPSTVTATRSSFASPQATRTNAAT